MNQGGSLVQVVQSAFWHTNTGVITAPDGSVVLIDPGVLPVEIEQLADHVGPDRIRAALVTHEDWDHVLWSTALGRHVRRLAHPRTVQFLTTQRDALLSSLTAAEKELGVTWDHDLAGRLEPAPEATVRLGDHLHMTFFPTPGHTDGHTSLVLEGEGVVFAGDMLSDIDIPMLADTPGALEAYLGSLDTLQALIADAHLIVPGHGTPCDQQQARQRLDHDRAYLNTLATGMTSSEFLDRDPRWQREENRKAHRQHLVTLGLSQD